MILTFALLVTASHIRLSTNILLLYLSEQYLARCLIFLRLFWCQGLKYFVAFYFYNCFINVKFICRNIYYLTNVLLKVFGYFVMNLRYSVSATTEFLVGFWFSFIRSVFVVSSIFDAYCFELNAFKNTSLVFRKNFFSIISSFLCVIFFVLPKLLHINTLLLDLLIKPGWFFSLRR